MGGLFMPCFYTKHNDCSDQNTYFEHEAQDLVIGHTITSSLPKGEGEGNRLPLEVTPHKNHTPQVIRVH